MRSPRIFAWCDPRRRRGALRHIEGEFGAGTVMRMGEEGAQVRCDAIPTGADLARLSAPPGPWYPESMAIKTNPAVEPAPRPGPLTVLVDADEFDAAMADPLVLKANEEATEYLERLEREGRSI
jgi:hypothetical protein